MSLTMFLFIRKFHFDFSHTENNQSNLCVFVSDACIQVNRKSVQANFIERNVVVEIAEVRRRFSSVRSTVKETAVARVRLCEIEYEKIRQSRSHLI